MPTSVHAFIRSDEEIEAEILSDIVKRVLWVEPGTIEVAVRDGEVELGGELDTDAEAEVLERLVEKIPGVVSVRSKVTARVEGADRTGRLAGSR